MSDINRVAFWVGYVVMVGGGIGVAIFIWLWVFDMLVLLFGVKKQFLQWCWDRARDNSREDQ